MPVLSYTSAAFANVVANSVAAFATAAITAGWFGHYMCTAQYKQMPAAKQTHFCLSFMVSKYTLQFITIIDRIICY